MRIVLRYARSGPAAYISHLDMQRAFGRAVRRARIPALYSQGFNPHLVMSFASPLSVGYETQADYLELAVEDGTDLQQTLEALRKASPPGIEVTGVYPVADGSKKLMALNSSASYTIRFGPASAADCSAVCEAARHLQHEKLHLCTDRKGRTRDLKKLLRSLSAEGDTITLTAANASGASLNPATVAEELLSMAGLRIPYSICRTECYGEKDGRDVPFRELFSGGAESC